MVHQEFLPDAEYVVDANGRTTKVIIPFPIWQQLVALVEAVEDKEDVTILQEWLKKRASGKVSMIPLDALEQELRADSLLSG